MRVIILGQRGMLGQMAVRYFNSRGAQVITVDERFTFQADCPALAKLPMLGRGLVLNCVGRIKQKEAGRSALFDVNAVLPAQLCERMAPGQFLVQPSTDCVFAGHAHSPYPSGAKADALDDYGWSKRLGEVAVIGKPNAAVCRVSIIGPDAIDPSPRGLLGWFLDHPTRTRLHGYCNHFWNGITTLEWCRLVERLFASGGSQHAGQLIQLGTEEVHTKYAMLCLFQEIFETDFDILSTEAPDRVYRALKPDIASPGLRQQLADLKTFWNS